MLGAEDLVFVDLRDVRELKREGGIPGAFHCPRGLLEFWIDPDSPYHNHIFAEPVAPAATHNESLNGPELAARLSIPGAHLSEVLNSVLELPVRDFMNRYRVKEAQRLMKDPAMRHLPVEEIGYAAGFRSRSGFYGAFKRETGRSPAASRPDVY